MILNYDCIVIMITNYDRKTFIVLATAPTIGLLPLHHFHIPPRDNIIRIFIMVIYCHSMVLPSFCVIKQYYRGNYCRMAIDYCGICVTNVLKHNLTSNGSNILHHFNPRKVGLELLW